MKQIEVKAREGITVPTPHGRIGSGKALSVPKDAYIRRRIAEGDLIVQPPGEKAPAKKARKTPRGGKRRTKQ